MSQDPAPRKPPQSCWGCFPVWFRKAYDKRWQYLEATARKLPDSLRWLCCVTEFFVCLVVVLFVVYLGLTYASGSTHEKERLKSALSFVHRNWLPFLFILILLFFQSIKQVLLKVKSLFGVETASEEAKEIKLPGTTVPRRR